MHEQSARSLRPGRACAAPACGPQHPASALLLIPAMTHVGTAQCTHDTLCQKPPDSRRSRVLLRAGAGGGRETNMADELVEIPLFPLGLVLFPGMALPLHIFVSRDRHLIGDFLADGAPFAVALALAGGTHEHGLPAPACTPPRLAASQRLPGAPFH